MAAQAHTEENGARVWQRLRPDRTECSQPVLTPNQRILWEAVKENDVLQAHQMLEFHHTNPNMQDYTRGWTPLHEAAAHGADSLVELLLKHGAQPDAADDLGDTPLHWACARDHPDVVLLLLGKGANANTRNLDQETPLHKACHNRSAQAVEALLAHGASVDAMDEDGETPLLLACSAEGGRDCDLYDGGHVAAARTASTTDSHISDSDVLVLGNSRGSGTSDCGAMLGGGGGVVSYGSAAVVAALLRGGADAGYRRPTDGRSALHVACGAWGDAWEVAELLLQHPQPPPPHAAAHGRPHAAAVRSLLDARCAAGHTALHAAAAAGNVRVVEVLLENGADVNALTCQGASTPLHLACSSHHHTLYAAKMLLLNGADAFAKDKNGKTPLDLAKARAHPEASAPPHAAEMVTLLKAVHSGTPWWERKFKSLRRSGGGGSGGSGGSGGGGEGVGSPKASSSLVLPLSGSLRRPPDTVTPLYNARSFRL